MFFNLFYTLKPDTLRAKANCVLTVDFPTPPLPDSTRKTCFTPSNISINAIKRLVNLTKNRLIVFFIYPVFQSASATMETLSIKQNVQCKCYRLSFESCSYICIIVFRAILLPAACALVFVYYCGFIIKFIIAIVFIVLVRLIKTFVHL